VAGKRIKNFDLPPRVTLKGKAYYYTYRDVSKKKIFIPLGSDRAEMLKNYAEIDPKYRGTNARATRGTFDELAEQYAIYEMPNKAQSTQENQKYFLKKLREVFGHMKPSNINSTHIARYLDKSTHKVAANREINLLSAIFSKGIRWGLCTVNPCLGVARNKESSRERYITDDELKLLRDAAPTALRCMIDLAYITGMRRGDILDLRKAKPSHIKPKERISYINGSILFVHQKKTGKRINYKIEGMLKVVIERSLEISNLESGWLFTNTEGNPYTETAFNSLWRRFVKKLDISDVHFHDLRAKAATDAKKLGHDAQKLLGHADAKMTEVYIRNRQIDEVEALHSSIIMVEDGK